MRSLLRSPLALAPLTPLLLLTACAGPLNTESCIGVVMPTDSTGRGGGVFCPPTITESSIREVPEEAAATVNQRLAPVYVGGGDGGAVVQAGDARPSVVSLERGNWGATQVTAPNDLSAHQPRYSQNLLLNDTLRRTRGEYPTAASALDTGTSAGMDRQIQEALVAPLAAAADVVLFVPRAVVQARPDRPTRTGLEPYQRQPRVQTIVPPPLVIVAGEMAGPRGPMTPMVPAPGVPSIPGSPVSPPAGQQVSPTPTAPANTPPLNVPPSSVPPTSIPPGPESSRPPERKAPWERSTVRPGTRSEPKKD